MRTKHWITASLLVLIGTVAAAAETTPGTWDGLVEVKTKKLDSAFLAPGADFRPYTKIMVDPTQAAFSKDWMKNMNDQRDITRRIDEDMAKEMLQTASTNFADVFQEAFTKAGYTVVTTPGPDVLRVSPSVANLYVNAPDIMAAGRSRTYSTNAGEATMILEVRDSMSNALIARVVDRRMTRETFGLEQANRVTNSADFRSMFRSWADISVKGLATLKTLSPLPATLQPKQKLD